MGSIQEPNFTRSPEIVTAHALLFDFDGRSSLLDADLRYTTDITTKAQLSIAPQLLSSTGIGE